MLNSLDIKKVVFLDIETVPQYPSYRDMPQNWQELFDARFRKDLDDKIHANTEFIIKDEIMETIYHNKASLFAEFGKIVCISIGWVDEKKSTEEKLVMVTKSFANKNEKELLTNFYATIKTLLDTNTPTRSLVAYNGFMFDFVFMAKRFLVNGFGIPKLLDFSESKPWEVGGLIDPKTIWKYNVFDHNTSLSLVAKFFDLPTSKDEMDGSQVKDEYYIKDNLSGITKYCEKDIKLLAQIVLKMKNSTQTIE